MLAWVSVCPNIWQSSGDIHKVRQDGFLIGQPLSLRNFCDGLMETAHKTTKVGTISYSRGKQEPSRGHPCTADG